MDKIKIVLVSYSNSLPFAFGLLETLPKDEFEVVLANPSNCAKKLISKEVSVGLIPVAALPQIKDYQIISNYGIGAKRAVRTVALFSDVPMTEIKEIYLDYQSRTSVQLIQILAKNYWNISTQWISAEAGFEKKIAGTTAGLVIGDRAFDAEKKHPYVYDLASEWIRFTKLPFVFACWVSRESIEKEKIDKLNASLKYGLDHISDGIDWFCQEKGLDKDLIRKYLNENISYNIDDDKKAGMNLFLNYLKNN